MKDRIKHRQDMKRLHGKQRNYLDIVLIFYNLSITSSSLWFKFTKTLKRHCFSINLISPEEQLFLWKMSFVRLLFCALLVILQWLCSSSVSYVNSRNINKTLAKRLLQLYSICSMVTIQHKKITVVAIFEIVFLEIVFLEILNVTIQSVF